MNRKLLAYILVLIGAWLLWDYTRHRHTEMWWFKRFLSYPGIKPSDKNVIIGAVKMAFDHLQRLKKYHPEKIRPKLPFEKEEAFPVRFDLWSLVPREHWWVDLSKPYDKYKLSTFQKHFIVCAEASKEWHKIDTEIRKKYSNA